jgi:hypothetical protein
MRLWSIHPKYLDSKGLVALWREALLARKSLQGKTKAYRNHPQTKRFESYPLKYINTYIQTIYKESCARGYCFDKRKLEKPFTKKKIPITKGQLEHEFKHLKRKLKLRHKEKYKELLKVKSIQANPLFRPKKGRKEFWEKAK